jgi:hypothetical protein
MSVMALRTDGTIDTGDGEQTITFREPDAATYLPPQYDHNKVSKDFVMRGER